MLETRGEVIGKKPAQAVAEISPDRLYKLQETWTLEGIGPTTGHHRLRRGEYDVVRDGTSQPKITGRSILRRRELHLQPAKYGARAGIRGITSKEKAPAKRKHRARPLKHERGPGDRAALSSRGWQVCGT